VTTTTSTILPPSPEQSDTSSHAIATFELIDRLVTNPERGLSEADARHRQARHGPNELAEAPPQSLWRKLLGQVNQPVIWVLLAAAAVAGSLGEWPDALAILAIVLLNALLGFFQEERAGRALAALRQMSAPLARVLRDGELRTVPARELVPGDRIELEAGDHVPADARLMTAFGLRVQEAALTGESAPVDKDAHAVLAEATPLGDRRNMIFAGTEVAAGKASAVVVATGMRTELGRIAGMLQRYSPEPTPLQRRLAELGKVLTIGCLIVVAGVFVLALLRGGQLLDVFLLSVSLAVAAVPEGLPAVVTVALALGLQRMVRRNALVRRLPSVETLGSVTVICSDKTGTLTRNEMTVREILAGGRWYYLTGAGYAPRGQILTGRDGAAVLPVDAATEPELIRLLTVAARCNNAKVTPRGDGSGAWEVVGDPTEGALLTAALKGGVGADGPRGQLIAEIPFDSERKAMSVIVREQPGLARMYTKGAPEVVLGKCVAEFRDGRVEPLTEARRQEVLRSAGEMAGRALRVLALAYREVADGVEAYQESDLVFAGLAGMIDPPREEAKDAVHRCQEAGIRPVMITGDHPATAMAIGRELGIAGPEDVAVTGRELDALSDADLATRVDRFPVYARVTAEHKLRVVRAWKARGHVVAMTGDGVNDAPAVKSADIGIAMGRSGTDVTREASAMVLTDDNFASIVNAVEEGRGIYDNIQKFLHYLLAGNVGLVLFVVASFLAGWPFPLTTTQILWMNLVTNGLPALALGMEPPERDVMRRRPRPPREPVLTPGRSLLIAVHGALVAAVTTLGFALVYQGDPANLPRARTVAFCVVSFSFILFALSCRSLRYTMPEVGPVTNPALLGAIVISGLLQLSVVTLPFAQGVFETAGHFGWEWGLVAALALAPVTTIEVSKLIRARFVGPLLRSGGDPCAR
jgi:P-type Ca2+ transporter type 2C